MKTGIKKSIIYAVIAVVMFINVFSCAVYAEPGKSDAIGGMTAAAENRYLTLYFSEQTTDIAVKVKGTGAVWYSNPTDWESDTIADGDNKNKLRSQLILDYYTQSTLKTIDNFSDSIKNKQFTIEKKENGVKIIYTIGKITIGFESIPKTVSKSRFDELILSKITDENDRKALLKRYKLYSLKDAATEEKRKTLIKDYPNIEKNDVYALSLFTPEYEVKDLYAIIQKTGYTGDDLAADNRENKVDAVQGPENITFEVPMEYSLDNENLIVKIACKEIKSSSPANYLYSFKVLPFFGAAGQAAKGYMFVPDGSGALIYLNNEKRKAAMFRMPLYGPDKSTNAEEKLNKINQCYLPVYGLKQNDDAFLAIIEGGDSHAYIDADISGRMNSYNSVYPEFNILPKDEINMTGNMSDVKYNLYQSKPYQGDIKIRYAFLKASDAGYVGMAKYYQKYLTDKNILKKLTADENLPFNVEMVGAIVKNKSILGIPFKVLQPLTTYDQAVEILEELKAKDIKNIKFKYTGWFNKGVNHSVPSRITLDWQLGGKGSFTKLLDYLNENKIEFFPDVAFQNVYKGSIFDFNSRLDAVRYIFAEVVSIFQYNRATFRKENLKDTNFLLSPYKLPSFIDRFLSSFKKHSVKGISLRDMGSEINSDFRANRLVDREAAEAAIVQQMAKIDKSGLDIMVNGGNAPVLPYVRNILNMPMEDSHFLITDECIPFYQLVVHGYISYSGEPVNLAEDYYNNLLKTVETGGGAYFKWTYADSSVTKDTDFAYLYSANYKDWLDEALTLYNRLNKDLKDIQDKRITNHEWLAEGVYKTTFENGTAVIVNYNRDEAAVDGIIVGGREYTILKGGIGQ